MGVIGTEVNPEHSSLVWHYILLPMIKSNDEAQKSRRALCKHLIVIKPIPWNDQYECSDCGIVMQVEPKG
jgi:hypothetical protein